MSGKTIINGGEKLKGSPSSYEEADLWVSSANKDKDGFMEPKWSFDCGFKLDFDGPIISARSRFYPPAEHYGPKWDGVLSIYILNSCIYEKKFIADTLNELKSKVEHHVKYIASGIRFENTIKIEDDQNEKD